MKRADGSWDTFDDYVVDFALDRRLAGDEVAIVTLAGIDGTSPRPVGAQMAVAGSGEWVGYLSGGCFERAVVNEALEALRERRDRVVRFGRDSKYLDIQLPCGSAVDLVFATAVPTALLASIQQGTEERRTVLADLPYIGEGGAPLSIQRRYEPRRRLVLIGVGPTAVQLAHLGVAAGFEVLLYSPDQATREALSGSLVRTIPILGTRGPELEIDSKTAVVFLFHDHEWELDLLPAALGTDAFYIGAIGSRKTQQARLHDLARLGVPQELIDRLHGPAGLFAGAKNAQDVALSILAEIAKVERDLGSTLLG